LMLLKNGLEIYDLAGFSKENVNESKCWWR
jgi:hypothetical protein